MNRMKLFAVSALAAALSVSAAQAVQYTFDLVAGDGNHENDLSGQLFLDVTDSGGGEVLFTISNNGPIASSVGAVYMDDGAYFSAISGLIDKDEGVGGDVGVDFSYPGNNNFPEGNTLTPPFETTQDLTADRDTAQANGINSGESLGISFLLLDDVTFSDVLAGLDDGSIRVGLHVMAIAPGGGSDSYVNGGRVSVPDAATSGAMMTVALGMLAWARRKIA